MVDSEASSKKIKMTKTIKKLKGEVIKKDDKGIVRKQQELTRVLHVKNFQLQNGNLSYMEYVELREELLRLNALKDLFAKMSGAME